MKTLKDFDVAGKRVIVRCDFNVPLNEKGEILDDFRIKKVIPTIEYLTGKEAKVILISHLGRPEPGSKDNAKFSLKSVAEKLEKLLGKKVEFLNDCVGKEVKEKIQSLKVGEIALLENVRFYKEETEADPEFAKQLSELGDIFIQDAFGVCHRAHASTTGLPQYLPAGIGFLVAEEIETLSRIMESPSRPLVAIIGGAKINTKVKLIERFLKEVDSLLLGGMVANVVLDARGVFVGKSTPWPETAAIVSKLNLGSDKIYLPLDAVATENDNPRQTVIGDIKEDELVLDIGPETIALFSKMIKEAKTIIWNGPLGLTEDERYSQGTRKIIEAILASPAFSVVGGGETVELVNNLGLTDKFGYVSTGGGAMLKFLGGEELPGIEAIK
ncbi:MAG: phosphoglycerate kinase [bacterium]